MTPPEQAAQSMGILVGTCLAAFTAGWVIMDARRRGMKLGPALLWGTGVMMALIIFLPIYLLLRQRFGSASPSLQPIPMSACPYCGYVNKANANFCERCNRQLKSSQEIHSKAT